LALELEAGSKEEIALWLAGLQHVVAAQPGRAVVMEKQTPYVT
jgi:hypothetical protein